MGYAAAVNDDGGDFLVTPDVGVLLWALAFFVLVLGAAYYVGRVAQRRGQSRWGWAIAAVLFTPPVVYLVLLVVTQRPDAAAAPTPAQPLGAWGVTTGPDSLATDHTAELERLADLRDRGALTDEEFEAQKAHVLERGAG